MPWPQFMFAVSFSFRNMVNCFVVESTTSRYASKGRGPIDSSPKDAFIVALPAAPLYNCNTFYMTNGDEEKVMTGREAMSDELGLVHCRDGSIPTSREQATLAGCMGHYQIVCSLLAVRNSIVHALRLLLRASGVLSNIAS